ncbi:MAG TPA: hypothetical protein VF785_09320 [Gemmatimonadaceae bacterium]
MKQLITVTAIVSLAGCHRTPPVIASTEGVYIGGSPSLLKPARTPEAALLSAGRGALVVIAAIGPEPSSHVEILLQDSRGVGIGNRITDATGSVVFSALKPGTYTVSARRIGLQVKAVQVLIGAGFADTLMFSLGQRG